MKKILPLLLFLNIIACSNKQNVWTADAFSVKQIEAELLLDYTSTRSFSMYEIAYLDSSNIAGLDSAEIFTTSEKASITKAISELDLEPAVRYNFWIRGVGDEGDISMWSEPISIQIEDFCREITSLNFSSTVWWGYRNQPTFPTLYEVQYGAEGFELGSGEIVRSSRRASTDLVLEKGTTYDVYVRARCSRNLGYSTWYGPATHYADRNFNVCIPPNEIIYYTTYNQLDEPVGALITWNDEGRNKNYEFVLVEDGESPDSGTLKAEGDRFSQHYYSGLIPEKQYDFYVRSLCIDGARTEWLGPTDIVIK
ncbi:MAG: hypothetical protein AB8F95_08315 [Bacteroidia bacterium]